MPRSNFADSITNCLRRLDGQTLMYASLSIGNQPQAQGPPKYADGFGAENDVIYSPTVDGDLLPKVMLYIAISLQRSI